MKERKLNQEQREAVTYTDGPLLIVAGAGTGKTTVITQKIAHLVESGEASPEQILALTFTEKAAQEMLDRVDQLVDVGYVDMHISTFHAFCQKLLEEYGLEIGLPNQFKVLSSTDLWLLMREHIYDFKLDYYRPLGNPARHIHELLRHFSKCKDELISPDEYLKYAEEVKLDSDDVHGERKSKLKEIAHAYHVYNQLLLDTGSLDFGDLIYHSVRLVRERKSVLESLQNRFKYILIDEFQDVNYAQYELTKELSAHGQLTVVGDDDQSVYAFRGASVSNILRFKDDYASAREIVLTKNYRSGQEILDLSGKSIKNNNPDRLEVKLGIDKDLKSQVKSRSEIIHLHSASLDDEVSSVIEKIVELKKDDISFDDFCILVRANSHVAPFAQALEKSHIPYEYIAAAGLYRQPIVLDAINFFRLLDNHKESDAVYRLLKLPFFNFSVNDLHQLTSRAKKKSIGYYAALKKAAEFRVSKEGIAVCENLLSLIHDGMKRASFEKPTAVLHHFMQDSGYFAYLTEQEEKGDATVIRQIHQLRQFFDYISSFEQVRPDADISLFMNHFSYVLESGDSGKLYQPYDTPDSVNIMTIHGAKGLEFRYVFVVNLVEDRFPTRRRGEAIRIPDELVKEQLPEGDAHIQEERRLLYVAMTRAKEKLFFTSADNYGGVRKKKLSRFLDELGYSGTASPVKSRGIVIAPAEKQDEARFMYQLPKKFSYSQIQDYLRCPYKYKLKYLLKIPEKGSPYFSFGNTMHLTLQRFYERVQDLNAMKQDSLFGLPAEVSVSSNIKVPPLKELLDLYEKNWIGDWFESKRQREDYYAKGKEVLKQYYASNDNQWTIPVALEKYFKIPIGRYIVHGKIDRVDSLPDGMLEIIDYKTGKSKEKVVGSDKDQLLIYQIAASTLTEYVNIGKVDQLTYYYLNDDLKISFIGSDKDIEVIKKKIIDTLDAMHEQDWHTITRETHSCRECESGLV